MAREVIIVDTAPRDGLGALPRKVPTSEKVALANCLVEAGVSKIDCAAFTHPRLRPEYADAEQVIEALPRNPNTTFLGIAPNEVACRRALSVDVDEIGILIGATESFNKLVLGTSIKETLFKTFPPIFQACNEKEKPIRVYLLAAFGCEYEGKLPTKSLVELIHKLGFMGAKEISLVDSTGMANPKLVRETIRALDKVDAEVNIAVHFHNTRGLAMANILAAYEEGVRIFDSALGGLSGTPFGAPKMNIGSWNVATEDLVYLFEQMGVNTGIDLDGLIDAVRFAEKLARQELPGHILRARVALDRQSLPSASALTKIV